MQSIKTLLIPKAGHLFDDEESSIMEKVAEISREWFTKFLLNMINLDIKNKSLICGHCSRSRLSSYYYYC